MSEKNAQPYVDDNGETRREGTEEPEDKCSVCSKKSEPCISFFAHENSLMHKDLDNERAHRQTLFVCATVIILTLIFVVAYTLRMNTFVDLIKEMNAALIQISNAKGIIAP